MYIWKLVTFVNEITYTFNGATSRAPQGITGLKKITAWIEKKKKKKVFFFSFFWYVVFFLFYIYEDLWIFQMNCQEPWERKVWLHEPVGFFHFSRSDIVYIMHIYYCLWNINFMFASVKSWHGSNMVKFHRFILSIYLFGVIYHRSLQCTFFSSNHF